MGCSHSKPGDPTNDKLAKAPVVKAAEPAPTKPAEPVPEKTATPPPAEPAPKAPEPTPEPEKPPVDTVKPAEPEKVAVVEPEVVPEPVSPPPPETKVETPATQAIVVTDQEQAKDAFGLLLCGAGESGKTTFTRQLKLKYLGGFSDSDREGFVATIRGNMIETLQFLKIWCEHHDQSVEPDNQEAIDNIGSMDAFDTDFTVEISQMIKQLWEDPAIQEAFLHKDETAVPDHMDYFFEKIDELADENYQPTDEDVLKARIRSIGVEKITFNLEGALTSIFDVGGQKNERSKWDRVMGEVSGVIFCVSFAEFDKPMFEDASIIRIFDALEIFKDITHRKQFLNAPFFFLANKIDIFNEKIEKSDSFQKIFPEFTGDVHSPEECSDYLISKFLEAADPQLAERPIKTYKISALNSDDVVATTNQICKFISETYYE